MESPIKFGTDGWRAIIGEDYTYANVRVCAQSVAQYLKTHGLAGRGLVIGYDTRFASEHFAATVAEVVTANGIKVYLSDRASPTQVISYSILDKKAGGAVIITASHNPAVYNGVKYKPDYAGSASPEVVAELEAPIPQIISENAVKRIPLDQAQAQGLLDRFDPKPAYVAHLSRLVDMTAIRTAGLTIVHDCMYGTGAGYISSLLADGTKVVEYHPERNPAFPGIKAPEPIAPNLTGLCEEVKRLHADVGVANDGDADRMGIVDERGVFLNQLQVFGLLTYYLLEVRKQRGPIVKSLTTTQMVRRLGELYNVPVHETAVGFKYLGPKMIETDAIIGGEESGGYGFRGHIPERDGILANLYFLDFMARTGKKPSELLAELYDKVGPHYYDRIDVHLRPEDRDTILRRVSEARPTEIAGMKVVGRDTTDGYRFLLDGGGWTLIRFSGTEPLVRIYTEITNESAVPGVLQAAKDLAGV